VPTARPLGASDSTGLCGARYMPTMSVYKVYRECLQPARCGEAMPTHPRGDASRAGPRKLLSTFFCYSFYFFKNVELKNYKFFKQILVRLQKFRFENCSNLKNVQTKIFLQFEKLTKLK
jgi:hypothetical protein